MRSKAGSDRLAFIEFQLPTLVEAPPEGDGWVHEIKYDGFRTQLIIGHGGARAFTRNGYDWTAKYRQLVEAAASLPVKSAILDGEATALGSTGMPDFQALRRELGNPRSPRLIYYVFDILHLDGKDLRSATLLERKEVLKGVLQDGPEAFIYADFIETDGESVFEHACRMGLEGVVSKLRDAPYRSGRQDSWVKLKCVKSDTFPIVAFVEKLGARPRKIASLYVGRREGERLLYAGKVGTGYSEATARELRERLDQIIIRKSPLSAPIKKPKATWVRPVVYAEVKYSGITDDGVLRAAAFKGVRDDLAPPELSVSEPAKNVGEVARHGVPRENILQLLPDAVAPSKDELAAYWRKVAKRALVHLGRRPLKLVRHNHGITFYHKGKLPEIPRAVHQLRVQKREGGEGVRVWVDDLDGLLGLVEMGAVELHPWNATIEHIEQADRIVMDLDPGQGVVWDNVVEAALAMREIMRSEGLDSWPKVTGGKGLHLMAPLSSPITHDAARHAGRAMAQRLVDMDPTRFVLSSAPGVRVGRIFLDYLRNGRGNTAVGAYSPRARPGFPMASPVTWSQVERGVRPNAFTIYNPFRMSRVAELD
jgi:bifunctional non-homologous end joining protein LigD